MTASTSNPTLTDAMSSEELTLVADYERRIGGIPDMFDGATEADWDPMDGVDRPTRLASIYNLFRESAEQWIEAAAVLAWEARHLESHTVVDGVDLIALYAECASEASRNAMDALGARALREITERPA